MLKEQDLSKIDRSALDMLEQRKLDVSGIVRSKCSRHSKPIMQEGKPAKDYVDDPADFVLTYLASSQPPEFKKSGLFRLVHEFPRFDGMEVLIDFSLEEQKDAFKMTIYRFVDCRQLDETQKQILDMYLELTPDKEMAYRLGISQRSLSDKKRKLCKQLNFDDIAHAVVWYTGKDRKSCGEI